MDRNKCSFGNPYKKPWSLSARRAWIEIVVSMALDQYLKSLSARRAWIEICGGAYARPSAAVALRKESVDRNGGLMSVVRFATVALRKESVDRNTQRRDFRRLGLLSLSARRAWIEIITQIKTVTGCVVALRKESVDRNADTMLNA